MCVLDMRTLFILYPLSDVLDPLGNLFFVTRAPDNLSQTHIYSDLLSRSKVFKLNLRELDSILIVY